MKRGHVRQRGAHSFELKYEVASPDASGRRRVRYETIRADNRKEAEKHLTAQLAKLDAGIDQKPTRMTLAKYLREWLVEATHLGAKTAERYGQLIEQQIIPHLGATLLHGLQPKQLARWHSALLAGGGAKGRPLSARTCGHAHRVLRTALARAVELEILSKNVAAVLHPPPVPQNEIIILTEAETVELLPRIGADPSGETMYPVVALALASGLRRGELCALAWSHLDIHNCIVKVERSLEETAQRELRFKKPKTKHGRRRVTIPRAVVDVLLRHRRRQTEIRLALGMGGLGPDDLIFARYDGTLPSPDNLSRDWRRLVRRLKLPSVPFHALRHTHASVLIHSGLDVVAVSRRLGHGSPAITLSTYSHLFHPRDGEAAIAIERAMGGLGRTLPAPV